MIAKIFTYLKYEYQLLNELLTLAERQQKALVKFDTNDVEITASYQEITNKNLIEAEKQRILFLTRTLNISTKEAKQMKLSALEMYFQKEELTELIRFKNELKTMIDKLMNLNIVNRILANRAQHGVREVISALTNGKSHVCNVVV